MALAIMSSGGDAPGMNPAIKKFVDYTHKKGEESYLIYDGLEGLIDNKIKKASHKIVAGIIHNGGTIIRSSRSKRFFEHEYRQKAFDNLKAHNITGLVVLGGDGSFRAMEKFSSEFDLNFVGIPSTIDNDIYGTEYCLGVDTALNVIRDALDKIRDTATSFNRAFLVEVMGRDCGYLAIVSSMISGAEVCVIPEVPFNPKSLEKRLKKEVKEGRNYILAIVAEGTKKTSEVHSWLQDSFGLETRVSILGHIQRGGNPTVYDRMMAFDFTIIAVDHLLTHTDSSKVVVYQKGDFKLLDIKEVVSNKYMMPQHYLDAINYLD
ncbi:6-phosphofructokinase [Candidatus Sulfurimonas marisnigri]|uniref:6-phosphofructokinase n=1 Tax=Candidatus Sulfurimonas marisnigri TaxID=2740405 RepID=A0A7S7M253_9BACT|nr:6-phosphofructokinase [Candidatus Sulfurimonas marisnigri]QOY54844.1 6-phosphofructokinase [Candidatus Sulfurimonas marisnigri]